MIESALSHLLERLAAPLSAEERDHGWTPKAKSAIATYLREKKSRFSWQLVTQDRSLVRGLDAWGVTGGSLYDDILEFNLSLPE